jgi:hypothetical protein
MINAGDFHGSQVLKLNLEMVKIEGYAVVPCPKIILSINNSITSEDLHKKCVHFIPHKGDNDGELKLPIRLACP